MDALTAKVWIVGDISAQPQWAIQGVFTDEAKAVAACRTADYFVGPMPLDVALPADHGEWPGVYYPLEARMPVVHPDPVQE